MVVVVAVVISVVVVPLEIGHDEKGCKMDVDGRRRTSTVNHLEKCSLVNVDREKCNVFNINGQRSMLILCRYLAANDLVFDRMK